MNQNVLREIESLLNSIPASEYVTSHVFTKKIFDQQIRSSLLNYIKSIGRDINQKVKYKISSNANKSGYSTKTVDFVFKIGERKAAIKIDQQINTCSRDLMNCLIDKGYDVLWIIWSRVESPGFGKGYYENKIIELSNFIELRIPNIVKIYKPFKTLINTSFEDWKADKNKIADRIQADPWKLFPSHKFEDHFYFWLYQVKQESLMDNQKPWSDETKYWIKFSGANSLTKWGHKNILEIFEEIDNWWNKHYPDRYRFFDRFYDASTNLPFSFEYYRLKYLKSDSKIYSAINGTKYNFDQFMNVIVGLENEIILRDVENIIREKHGLPNVGEGWVSEMELFNLVRDNFPNETVMSHAKPEFLGRQHFDIYLPKYKIAIEYQGAQHHRPIEFFGGEQAFKKNLERDRRKRAISIRNNVKLIEVLPDYKEAQILSTIKKEISNQKIRLGIIE